MASCEKSLALHQAVDDRSSQATSWDSLGYAHHRMGGYPRALECFKESHALAVELGDRSTEATAMDHIGDTHDAMGDTGSARVAWLAAAEILDQLGDTKADKIRAKL